MRTIKGLGLVALAAFALIVFPAAASASGGIVADAYPATVEGDNATQFVWTNSKGAQVSCNGNSFVTTLTGPSEEFAATTVRDDGCFQMNGCKFEFNPGAGTVDIGPAGCGPITFQTWCAKMTIGAQTGLAATYSGQQIQLNAKNLKYTPLTNGCGVPPSLQEDGYLQGTWELTATSGGKAVGVDLIPSGDLPVGLFMAGGDYPGSSGGVERFDAQAFPVQVTGSQNASDKFRLVTNTGAVVQCNVAGFDAGTLSAATTQLALSGSFSGCTFAGLSATVDMNSCTYVLTVEEAFLYGGPGEISCAQSGDKIEVLATQCSIKIPAQSLFGINDYETVGSGSSSTIGVGLEAAGVQFEKVGSKLACAFAGKEASVLGGLSLSGTY